MKKFKGLYVPEIRGLQVAYCNANTEEDDICFNAEKCKKCLFNLDNKKEFNEWIKKQ